MAEDFVALAASLARAEFVSSCPFPFLVGETALRQPRSASRLPFDSGHTLSADREQLARVDRAGWLVLPVRKCQATFPSMITVGRTRNNDVVIPDALLSKFHAFFRVVDEHLELSDAGSANGTRLGGTELEPKAPGRAVRSGDLIELANLRFRFLEAGPCWEALRGSPPIDDHR